MMLKYTARYIVILFGIMFPISVACQDLPDHWKGFSNTASSHCIVLPKNVYPVVNSVIIDSCDFVGVFFYDNGMLKCGGASKYIPNENISIFAYGNDPFIPGKNGFYNGDSIFWKIHSSKNQMDIDLSFIKYKEDEIYDFLGIFTNLGISIIESLSAGSLTANAYVSKSEVCDNDNHVVVGCWPQGCSNNYSFEWKSIPEGFASTSQSFVCQITEDTMFEVKVNDNLLPHKDFAIGYTSVSYVTPPEITISSDTNVYAYNTFIKLNPKISNYSSVKWHTNGDGYFENHTNAFTKYYFGIFDTSISEVELTIEASTSYPCYYKNSKTIKVILDPNVSVNNKMSHCSVYPNPFSEVLHVKTNEKTKIRIYNSLGKLMLEQELCDGVSVIETGVFSNGIYFCELIKNNESKIIELIKK